MTFHVIERHVFEKWLCFQKSKAERIFKGVRRCIMEKYYRWYLGFKMKTNYSNLWSPIVSEHIHMHTLYALNSFLKSYTSVQYEHKGSIQLTNGSQVNPKGLFYQQWPLMVILAPEMWLKRSEVICFHNIQCTHTETCQAVLPAVFSPISEHDDKCSHSIILLCN